MTRARSRTHSTAPGARPAPNSLPLAAAVLAIAFLAPTAAPIAAAQDPPAPDASATDAGAMGRIVAVLVDGATRAPISDAVVSLDALGRRALSDSAGSAIFLDVPPGTYTLGIRHLAYGEQTALVDVEGMTSAIVALELDPRAIAVAPLDVMIEQRPRYLERQGFYDRRAVGMGTFFDPQFVDRWGSSMTTATRFVGLLMDMSPQMSSMVRTSASNGNAWEASIGDGFTGQCPMVYIDGQRAFNDPGMGGQRPTREIDMMSTYMFGAVEVYPDSHGVPDFALEPEMGCGAIVIWTNRWRGRTKELGGGDVSLCEPRNLELAQVEGEIRDEYTGVTLPGARVLATFARSDVGEPQQREVVADRTGRYRICDVPSDHSLSVQVTAADRTGPELQVPLEGRVVTRDLSLRVAGPGSVVGRVIDASTGRPVSSASIGVVGSTRRTQTDEQGYFAMDEVLPGDHVVEIEHLGFEPVAEVISIVADRTVDLDVRMSANPIEVEPLVVTALRDRRLEIRGFYDRRTWGERTGLGEFLGEDDLERRATSTVTGILREMSGLEVRCTGSRDCRVTTARASGCSEVNVYLNGTLTLGETRAGRPGAAGQISIDDLVHPSEIAGLEVYAGAGSVPAEFSGMTGRCGAIAIWTR